MWSRSNILILRGCIGRGKPILPPDHPPTHHRIYPPPFRPFQGEGFPVLGARRPHHGASAQAASIVHFLTSARSLVRSKAVAVARPDQDPVARSRPAGWLSLSCAPGGSHA